MSVFPLPSSRSPGSLRSRMFSDHENNVLPVSASKESVIRITCDQIHQLLFDVSDSLSDERLQHLCTVVLHRCQDAVGKPTIENDLKSSKSSRELQQRRTLSKDSLQAAISHRMANVVEKGTMVRRRSQMRGTLGSVKSVKSARNLFATLPNDDGQYDIFLSICDSDLMTNHTKTRQNYLNFKRSDSNVPLMMFVYFCGAFFMFTGFVWTKDVNVYQQYPTALLSIFFGMLGSCCLLWTTVNRVVFLSFQYNIVYLQRYHKFVVNLYEGLYGQWIDNGAILFAALSTGFFLVNTVLMDLCDPDMVVAIGAINHHVCFSFEAGPESFVLTMVFTVVIQIVARGVTRTALVCSWVICIVAINVTLYLSDGGSYAWINLLQFMIMWVSYELERRSLRQYLKTVRAIEAGEMAAKLQLRLASYKALQASDALTAKCSLVRYYSKPSEYPIFTYLDMFLIS